jgi:pyruvate,water dikinase
MSLILPFERIADADRPRVGGKAHALSAMARAGAPVPAGVCVTVDAYRRHLKQSGLAGRIRLELSRKAFADMRWEEIWDAALRIRNMFLTTPLSPRLSREIGEPLGRRFGDEAVVVRSSAPGEDSAQASFAGLHESFVNVKGPEAIVERVRLVWASLWSDAALLYRRELGLDVGRSSMAVIVQALVQGERSGVAFSRDPSHAGRAAIEAVHGLNQGLVDGAVEPDRWLLEREGGRIVAHVPAVREHHVVAGAAGVANEPLPHELRGRPPLDEHDVRRVYLLLRQAEEHFGSAQDIEWTMRGGELFLLQSRPLTTAVDEEQGDKRPWYRSLKRSFENLRLLRARIEGEILPAMLAAAGEMVAVNLAALAEGELRAEILRRVGVYNSWVAVYWDDLIPFAHGIRLFGIAYNDALRPRDPYEFMDLLSGTGMEGVERNRMLEQMAAVARGAAAPGADPGESLAGNGVFQELLNGFMARFGDLSCGTKQCSQGPEAITDLVVELAKVPADRERRRPGDVAALVQSFLGRFEGPERVRAEELLDLARASYRTRDDDNLYLGRIKSQVIAAVEEYVRRFAANGQSMDPELGKAIASLGAPDTVPARSPGRQMEDQGFRSRARQITGQPAGPGIARGKARVLADAADLHRFRAGEVLVCDAVDPAMTFVVPLAAAIVERRGGMLIHGAIIAREYGIACVTGIADATTLIRTGDTVTVDGYLGIVTIRREEDRDGG